ncbi:hypothetical protein ACHAXN_003808 [Cyclotella atomus]
MFHVTFEVKKSAIKLDFMAAVSFLILPAVVAAEDGSTLANVVSVGVRPYYLVDRMKSSSLKDTLGKTVRIAISLAEETIILSTAFSKEKCAAEKPVMTVNDFSIGHRGAAMQFPEHTLESYKAAAIQGAGVIECDVTFTKDKQLVCRHSQCDLHTTTDVVTRPEMNAKCTTPFVAGSGTNPKCCTSDFTLEELKTLCAKMDSSGSVNATSAEAYAFGGTPDWRTDLYQDSKCHEIPTHKEYIEFVDSFGRKFTPELKTPSVEMPYDGLTQEGFAQMMIDEYVELGIPPEKVYPQSFLTSDVYYWVENTDYGGNAVALDEVHLTDGDYRAWHANLTDQGVRIVAPALWMLVESDPSSELGMKQSDYASSAQEHGLDIIAWTLERSPPGLTGEDVWYWQSLQNNTLDDGDKFGLLWTLYWSGVIGVFSDWPATVTYFANCLEIGESSDDTTPEEETEGEDPENAGGSRALRVASRLVSLALRFVGV